MTSFKVKYNYLFRFFSYSVFNEHFRVISNSGGDDGIRTHDPLLAGQVLSQLSYTPKLLGILLFSINFLRWKFLCLPFFSKKVSGRTKWTQTTD